MKKKVISLKIVISLIGIMLLLNCEKEEVLLNKDYKKSTIKSTETVSFKNIHSKVSSSFMESKNEFHAKSKDVVSYNLNEIIKLVDTLNNTRYSINFKIKNQPENVFYNLILGINKEQETITPFVIKYIADNFDEISSQNGLDMLKFKGTAEKYDFKSFLSNLNLQSKGKVNIPPCDKTSFNGTGNGSAGLDINNSNNGIGHTNNSNDIIENNNDLEGGLVICTWKILNWEVTSGDYTLQWSTLHIKCPPTFSSGGGILPKSNDTPCSSESNIIAINPPNTAECPEGYDENGNCVEDQIINKLTGKAKCVYEKLKALNLFKATIKKFENSNNYNLVIEQNNSCSSGIDACTDGKDVKNGNIKINIRITPDHQPLYYASTLLHEGIHAELFKYVDEYQKGIDPNNRKNLLKWYFIYKGDKYQSEYAQHQHMADKYVKPIAMAIRKLDNYSYPLEYYMGFGWDGLTKYGYDGYYDNGKWVSLDKSLTSQYNIKQKIVNDNTKLNGNECK
ncbi:MULTISPECIES: hypothetical protein [unclassified Tenacibaculum]|uniref:hypothetical protein n=1 Tax=unclassified Tenacibaculum TaxID=2635139 RepID=UPI001F28C46C|nr:MULTISPECIES: hypothetical protein [unclassified Tenacibaculum]MCF2875704.1 hypothetical protein [Tenacibaculum sp. Cn5-1]MCF2935780.1 hypothetical protein [Tenacibaculum sp. Cn5-34]MCG7512340.1 hypothetical protein [Tenacibaculum sp. Cn5-46]